MTRLLFLIIAVLCGLTSVLAYLSGDIQHSIFFMLLSYINYSIASNNHETCCINSKEFESKFKTYINAETFESKVMDTIRRNLKR